MLLFNYGVNDIKMIFMSRIKISNSLLNKVKEVKNIDKRRLFNQSVTDMNLIKNFK